MHACPLLTVFHVTINAIIELKNARGGGVFTYRIILLDEQESQQLYFAPPLIEPKKGRANEKMKIKDRMFIGFNIGKIATVGVDLLAVLSK